MSSDDNKKLMESISFICYMMSKKNTKVTMRTIIQGQFNIESLNFHYIMINKNDTKNSVNGKKKTKERRDNMMTNTS